MAHAKLSLAIMRCPGHPFITDLRADQAF